MSTWSLHSMHHASTLTDPLLVSSRLSPIIIRPQSNSSHFSSYFSLHSPPSLSFSAPMSHPALHHPTQRTTALWQSPHISYSSTMALQQESICSPLVLPQNTYPNSDLLPLLYSPSPSDTSSSSSTTPLLATSSPQPLHVICNAPLVAPIPLPYHSPTFLQFDLPDIDQDLSRPPFTTRRCSKRKHAEDDDANTVPALSKRRMITSGHDRSKYKPRRKHNR